MSTATLAEPTSKTRQVSIRADSVNKMGRSMRATFATNDPVEVFDGLESLHPRGMTATETIPFLLDHHHSILASIGSAIDLQVTATKVTGLLRFAEGIDQADDAFELVSQGHAQELSVGYRILESEKLQPGESRTVDGVRYTAPHDQPLSLVTRWQLMEISLVWTGADPGAGIGKRFIFSGEKQMSSSVLDVTGPNVRTMPLTQIFAAGMKRRKQTVPENNQDIFRRAMETPASVSELSGLVNTAILSGFRTAPDSTAGWARVVPLPDFLTTKLAAITTAPRMERLPRGGTASEVNVAVSSEGWGLARYAAKFTIAEEDLVNGHPFDVYAIALEEVGAAARRIIPDLVYSVLLSNGNMADDTAIFAAGRSNYITTSLAQASLDTGIAAIGNQLLTDLEDDPIHRGLEAKYLTVPPELLGTGKRLARDMKTGNGDLIVRSDSRLSTGGVVNPLDDSILTANGTNWLLSCPSDQAAGVVIGSLNGRMEPDVRHYALEGGQWGRSFDILFDVGCTVLTPEALFWSAGDDS